MSFPIAFFFIALVLAVLGWLGRRRRGWAAVLTNIAAVFLALGISEIYLTHQQAAGDGTRVEGSIVKGFVHPDALLGYAPARNARVTARKLYGDSTLYDVTYTTNSHGLRVTAPAAATARECVVFFGDSITFGEGVEDSENFPYVLSAQVADRYATYNFGFSGYGPQQMLANLESGRVGRVVDCTPKYFYYLCITDHAARVAGIYSWDRHGPRYELAPDGSVVQRGHFDDVEGDSVAAWAEHILDGSQIWQKLFVRPRGPEPHDISLLVAVIAQSARTIRQRFPDSVFEVIMWDVGDADKVRAIESGLAARGVHVRPMTSMVPDFNANWKEYVLSEHDRHPNKRFHRLMAEQIAKELKPAESPRAN